jgi:hypothetical protein
VRGAKELSPENAKRKKTSSGGIYVSPCFNLIQNTELQYERLLLKYPRAHPLFGVLLESQEIRQAGQWATVAQKVVGQELVS